MRLDPGDLSQCFCVPFYAFLKLGQLGPKLGSLGPVALVVNRADVQRAVLLMDRRSTPPRPKAARNEASVYYANQLCPKAAAVVRSAFGTTAFSSVRL